MPNIQGIHSQPASVQSDRPAEAAQNRRVPAELAGARPSRAAVARRVVLGILTLGISEGIRAVVRACRPKKAPAVQAARQPSVPAEPSADVFNRALAEQIRTASYDDASREAILEGLAVFGDAFDSAFAEKGLDAVPFKTAFLSDLHEAVASSSDTVTPQRLCALARETAAPMVGRMLFETAVLSRCAEIGLEDPETVRMMPHNLLDQYPALAAELQAGRDLLSLRETIDTHMPAVDGSITQRLTLFRAAQAARTAAVEGVARAASLDVGFVRENLALHKLDERLKHLDSDIVRGKTPLEGEAIPAAFQAQAECFIAEKARLFESARTLDLSPQIHEIWQQSVLTDPLLSRGDAFEVCRRTAGNLSTDHLTAALREPGVFSEPEIVGLAETLGAHMEIELAQAFGEQTWSRMGADEKSEMRYFTSLAVLSDSAELRTLLAEDPARVDRLRDMLAERIADGMDLAGAGDRGLEVRGRTLTQSARGGSAFMLAAGQIIEP